MILNKSINTHKIVLLSFLIGIFLYWSFLYPEMLKHQAVFSSFLWHSSYFWEMLCMPGGLSLYIGDFISQFFDLGLVGPLSLTLVTGIILYVLSRLMSKLAINHFLRNVVLISAMLSLLGVQSSYDFILGLSMQIVFVCVAVLFYVKIKEINNRMLYGLYVFPILMLLVSGGMLLIIYFLFLIYDFSSLKSQKSLKYVGGILCMFLGYYFYCTRVLFYASNDLFNLWNIDFEAISVAWQYVLFANLFFLVLISKFKLFSFSTLLANAFLYLYFFGGLYYLCVVKYYPNTERFLAMINATRQERWDDVIAIGELYNGKQCNAIRLMNLALNKKGLLPYKFFDVNQVGITGLMYNIKTDYFTNICNHELFYHLGIYNEALHWGSEALGTRYETSSSFLHWRLAETLIQLNKKEASKKYLFKLLHSPRYKTRVKSELLELKMGKVNTIVQNSWTNGMMSDFAIGLFGPMYDLVELAYRHPTNEMIRDYLLMALLMDKQVYDFYHFFQYYHQPNQRRLLPPIYEQALLRVKEMGIDEDVLKKYPISEETASMYYAYKQNVSKIGMLRDDQSGRQNQLKRTLWNYLCTNN